MHYNTTMKKLPVLILINGLAATGKTSLSKSISKKLEMPYFSKDDFRTTLVEELGTSNISDVKKFGKVSADIFRLIVERMVSSNSSVIIDQLFFSEIISPFLKKLKKKYNFKIVQIYCTCDPEVGLKRFIERSKLSERHGGFFEDKSASVNEVRERYKKGLEPIDIEGDFIEYNSTDLDRTKAQEQRIVEHIEKLL